MRASGIIFTLLLALVALVPALPAPAGDGLRTAVQIDLRTRRYPGETASHVMEEAARIFELSKAGYRVVYGKRGVIAYREWGWETIVDESVDLGVGGAAYWYVDLTQDGSDVVARVRCVREPDPHTSLDPADHEHLPGNLVSPFTMNQTAPQRGEDRDAAAIYAIFFNRLDVLLGQNRYWLYCRAAAEYVKMEKLPGSLDAWCLGAGDARPGEPTAP